MRFLIFLILFVSPSYGAVQCEFEEVYADGTIQHGFILSSDKKLRYQYLDQTLYTIILNQEAYLVRNDNNSVINKVNHSQELINQISEILSNFPDINSVIDHDDYHIKIEKTHNNEFIKRLSISGEELKLSLNLINCENKNISIIYFNHNPLSQYNF